MTVAAILKHKGHQVVTLTPDARVLSVAALLTRSGIGAAPVVDVDGHLVGMVSERDIVACMARHGRDALTMAVERIMTAPVQVIDPATTVAQAMEIMTDRRIRHLPVLEGGRMVGLVSIGDVVKARIMTQETEVNSLKAYVAGSV